ncbi:MAG: hypothetical protein PHT33_02420 [bacterium]|nr:hypothetical protein [bacterium]
MSFRVPVSMKTAAITALLLLLPATAAIQYENKLDAMAREGFSIAVFDRYYYTLRPDENRRWHATLDKAQPVTAIQSGMEHRVVTALRDEKSDKRCQSQRARLAARRFRLRNPELLYAITEFERGYANIWTDLQNYACSRGIPIGKTFGSLQMSTVTARNIEKKFLADSDIPDDLKQHLLPAIKSDSECRRRLLDDHWSYSYAAAWVYLWQKRHPNAPLMDFIVSWNDTEAFKSHWFNEAPRLLTMPET